MRLRKLFLVTALIVIGALLTWRHFRPPTPITAMTIERSNAAPKAKEVYGKKQSWPLANPSTKSDIPAECEDSWRYLTERPWVELERALRDNLDDFLKQVFVQGCMDAVPPMFQNLIQACSGKGDCLQAMAMHRAKIIARLWKHEKDLRKLDSSVLMNMLLAEFSEMANDPSRLDMTRSIEVARVLTEKEPDLYAAQKALTAGLFFQSFGGKASDADKAELLKAFADAEKFNQNDSELVEAQLFAVRETQGKNAFQNAVNELAKRSPQSGLAAYYQGLIAWQNKDRRGAVEALESAVMHEAQNERFKKTLEAVRKAPLGTANLFSLSLGFNFTDI